MKKILVALLCVIIGFSLIACGIEDTLPLPNSSNSPEISTESGKPDTTNTPTENENILQISVGDYVFEAELYDNETARQFVKSLPKTINMSELNGNEKYCYLEENLPSHSQRVGKINAGDIMLYGSNCLVLFYESFTTNYSYTNIGKIKNVQELAKAMVDNVIITFDIK